MSHDEERDRPRYRAPPTDQTMQLDSLGDELFEEVGPEAEPVEEPPPVEVSAAPPPLPRRRSSPMIYVLAAVVVLVAIGLGVGLGSLLTTDREPPPAAATPPAEPAGAIELDDVVIAPD